MTEQQINGRLEDWSIFFGNTIIGKIYDDPDNRWKDGTGIRTSTVESPERDIVEGGIIKTKNSRYLLGARSR